MGNNAPYKSFNPGAVLPYIEAKRLISYSARIHHASVPFVFPVSSGIGPSRPGLNMGDVSTGEGISGEGNNDDGSNPNDGWTSGNTRGINENTGGINKNSEISQLLFEYDSGIGSYVRFLGTSNLIIVDSFPVFYVENDDDDGDGDDDDDDDDSHLGHDIEE
ncbi:hypothetical protein BDD12DRAFT_858660 [Trichophaea hybrida]|nr:hypothetical protein BDD12DRAFT_858660 [Trichophaea hybrida]